MRRNYSSFNTLHSKLIIICDAAPADCPDHLESYSETIDKLKTVPFLNPKVIEDVTAIRDKFPCIEIIRSYMKDFVSNFEFLFRNAFRSTTILRLLIFRWICCTQ